MYCHKDDGGAFHTRCPANAEVSVTKWCMSLLQCMSCK